MNYTIANVIAQLFRIYNILIIIWCVLSWIPRGSGALDDFRGAIGMLVEPWLNIFQALHPAARRYRLFAHCGDIRS